MNEIVELNIPAKAAFLIAEKQREEQEKVIRRNDMRAWRKMPTLAFGGELQLKEWLTYTKWHKRPMTVAKHGKYSIIVTFLDHPDNKPKEQNVAG